MLTIGCCSLCGEEYARCEMSVDEALILGVKDNPDFSIVTVRGLGYKATKNN